MAGEPEQCLTPHKSESDELWETTPPTPDTVKRDFEEMFVNGRKIESVIKDRRTSTGRWVRTSGAARRL